MSTTMLVKIKSMNHLWKEKILLLQINKLLISTDLLRITTDLLKYI
jgi:hypothetical protein